MRRLHLFLLLLGLLLAGCPSSGDDDDSSDDDDDANDDDAANDDDSSDDDDDDDDSSDDDDSAPAGLQTSNEEAYCGPEPEPPPPENLMLSATGPGAIAVLQFNYAVGCCPELAVSTSLDEATSTIDIGYALTNDTCDCVCDLEVRFDLTGIPTGTWNLALPNGVSREFTVQ